MYSWWQSGEVECVPNSVEVGHAHGCAERLHQNHESHLSFTVAIFRSLQIDSGITTGRTFNLHRFEIKGL